MFRASQYSSSGGQLC